VPFITIRAPDGVINMKRIDQFKKELVAEVLRIEGAPNNDKAKSIAILIFDEIKKEDWCIGGESKDHASYIVDLKVPSGVLDDDGKKEMVAEVHKIFSQFSSVTLNPMQAWVIITEVTDGNWGFGGNVFRLENINNYLISE